MSGKMPVAALRVSQTNKIFVKQFTLPNSFFVNFVFLFFSVWSFPKPVVNKNGEKASYFMFCGNKAKRTKEKHIFCKRQ